MDNLIKLFKLLQVTRNHPQYGYTLAGISKFEISDLAQHHYLVALIALQLGYYFNAKGAKLNLQKILEISLTHDLGELFGGDINYFYGRANVSAREKAKAFEEENVKYLAKIFGDYGKEFMQNTDNFEHKDSDEAIIAQCADKMECVHYKVYIGKSTEGEIAATQQSIRSYVKKLADENLKIELEKFIDIWGKEMPGKNFLDILASEIKEYN